MIVFRVDRATGVPAYLQLIHQVRQALLVGDLDVGSRLPTARAVAETIGVNQNTVLKAYRELERDGIVEPRVGLGTFVKSRCTLPAVAHEPSFTKPLEAWLAQASHAGLSRIEIEALVETFLNRVVHAPR